MENISLAFNCSPTFKLHITSDVSNSCTLSIPFTAFTSTFVVNSIQVYIITLPSGNFHPMGAEATANNGIRVVAADSIEIKAVHHRAYFTESTLILPVDEIGHDYLIMTQKDLFGNGPSELVIRATQNNTSIYCTESKDRHPTALFLKLVPIQLIRT